jgi:hypothetical protein
MEVSAGGDWVKFEDLIELWKKHKGDATNLHIALWGIFEDKEAAQSPATITQQPQVSIPGRC